ncbi:hypothetical protein [Nocardia miyunensis]|uniref:hypothetical protein n=1 Tax=Nocardia miyunensis TaxID=282684 RepID=UPI00082F9EBC|nr:hypothetical protein [Nocardia miyunensis]
MPDEISMREILPVLVERLTEPPHERDQPRPRPVLVLEGCGGSGRTGALLEILDEWKDRTYAERLTSREWELANRAADDGTDERNPLRPLMVAIMVWLGRRLPGFRLTRMRMLVAHIAISTDFRHLALDDQLRLLDDELDKYCDPKQLRALLDGMTRFVGAMIPNPPPPLNIVLDAAKVEWISAAVPAIVRKAIRRRLDRAVRWYGHRDLGMVDRPEQVLIDLSNHARLRDPVVQRSVDDMLTGALLADLRESVSKLGTRTPNILLLLDDGDLPMATAFTLSLLRVRGLVAAASARTAESLTDPLTLVTTSSGALTAALHEQSDHQPAWRETEVRTILAADTASGQRAHSIPDLVARGAPALATRSWLRAELTGFTTDEILLRANTIAPFRARTIAANLERLTHRHHEATELALQKISANHRLWDDIEALLASRVPLGTRAPADEHTHEHAPADRRTPAADPSLEKHLLIVFAAGLDPGPRPTEKLIDALVTVSAARNLPEARSLFDLHDHDTIDAVHHPLYTSSTLWRTDSPDAAPQMHPLARYLGLRALATRAEPKLGWNAVFGLLRARCGSNDMIARLCCDRLLHRNIEVVRELAELHARLSWQDWTALFGKIVAAPDPHPEAPEVAVLRDLFTEDTREWHIATLLAAVPASRNPCVTDSATRDLLHRQIGRAETFLADPDTGPSGPRIRY